jgi:hypothetical protein
MLSKGIDTTIRELIDQLPKGLGGGNTSAGDFEKLIAPLAAQISSALVAAAAQTTAAPAAAAAASTAPSPAGPASAGVAAHRLSPFQLSVLRDHQSPMLEQLGGDLTAGDPQYNQRETLLRERLDVTELEHRLQQEAKALDVAYDRSDLEGILRNAGYDATHLGSSERYMAAIEKYVGEARNNYRQRSTNVPGQLA